MEVNQPAIATLTEMTPTTQNLSLQKTTRFFTPPDWLTILLNQHFTYFSMTATALFFERPSAHSV